MHKFRPSNLTQGNHIKVTEHQLISLIEKALNDNSLRGYLYKRSSATGKWRLKWFLLYQNLLFYFDANPNEFEDQSKQDHSKQDAAAAAAAANKTSATSGGGSGCGGLAANDKHQDKQRKSDSSITNNKRNGSSGGGSTSSSSFKSPRRTLSSLIKRGSTKHQLKQQQQQSKQPLASQPPRPPPPAPRETSQAPSDSQQLEFGADSAAVSSVPQASNNDVDRDHQSRSTSADDERPLGASALIRQHTIKQQQPPSSPQPDINNNNSNNNDNSNSNSNNTCTGNIQNQDTEANDKAVAKPSPLKFTPKIRSGLRKKIERDLAKALYWEPSPEFRDYYSRPTMISGHFFGHHSDQTIGKTTTTAAGRTPHPSVNYASLLSRRKGVVFLEGSYCEQVSSFPDWMFCDNSASSRFNSATRHNSTGSQTKRTRLNSLGTDQIFAADGIDGGWPFSAFNCVFAVRWKREGSKEYQFKSGTEIECLTWVHAISKARFSTMLFIKEEIEQQIMHLEQIVEHELINRIEIEQGCIDLSMEINELRRTILLLKRHEHKSNDLRLALAKSAAFCDKLMQKHRIRQQQKQRRRESELSVVEDSKSRRESVALQLDQQETLADTLMERDEERLANESPCDTREQLGSDQDPDDEVQELKSVVEALNTGLDGARECMLGVKTAEDLRKIKKVQAFFRGWLCRRRWKMLVDEYIRSPHAESMRRRNNLVFQMVECEEEYVEQLALLISAFLRPIKMAASSQKPPITHDELNCIFLNSETILFLHQIFLKGLTARMDSWPTLVLGDLFTMLLPMLQIYQEFVRNHHFSLQVLAECKQRDQFSEILRRLEEKPQLNGRTLETFLTYPMYQIPRYITCLHDILAHTPDNHVERKSLFEAQTSLRELSLQMQDEVSETENIRQNLSIERMIIGGCDILLDVNQVFVRQGVLLQISAQSKGKKLNRRKKDSPSQPQQQHLMDSPLHAQASTNQLAQSLHQALNGTFCDSNNNNSSSCNNNNNNNSTQSSGNGGANHRPPQAKDIRQCFLFTNHLIICSRTGDGKLHLVEGIGKISLSEVTLIENPIEFIQQQETMIANLNESTNHHHHHQQQQQRQQSNPCNQEQITTATAAGGNNTTASGAAAAADCGSQTQQSGFAAADGSTCPKRTSTVSAPGDKCNGGGHGEKKRVSHVGFELDSQHQQQQQQQQQQHQQQQKRTGSFFFSGGHQTTEEWSSPTATLGSQRKASNASARSWFPGYLANKLSNLTNLGFSSSNQLNQANHHHGTLSAPASPLTKRGQPVWRLSKNNNAQSGAPKKSHQLNNNELHVYLKNLFNVSRDYAGCDFILLLENNASSFRASALNLHTTTNGLNALNGNSNLPVAIHLVAPNLQEKAAWMSDISQCIDNVQFNDLCHGLLHDSSSLTLNQNVRTDPRLYKDDVDIKFSRALNSCKLPQIRYATKERLFERLTDLRFLSIDFLNTFLLTYRVFTTAEDVLEALKSVHYESLKNFQQEQQKQKQLQQLQKEQSNQQQNQETRKSPCAEPDSANSPVMISGNQVEEQSTPQKSSIQQKCGDTPVVQQQATQKKPVVPPRLQQAPVHKHLQPEISCGTRYLLAPGSVAQHQKRRSTLSALTPITGSTSSSLVNLTAKPEIPPNNQELQKHLPQPEPRTSTSGNDSANSSVFRVGGDPLCGSASNIDDELIASMNLSDEYLNDQDIMQSFDGQQTLERVRSSSMSNTGQLVPGAAANARLYAASSSNNLNVPGCRQIRANSVSNVPGLAARNGCYKRGPKPGSEHWRLCYKKSTANQDQKTDQSSVADPKSFLTATRYVVNSAAAARRASSSDADVTFQVTVHISTDNQQQQVTHEKGNCASEELLSLPNPKVPPSSPAEPTIVMSELDISNSSDCDNLDIKRSLSPRTSRRRCKTEPTPLDVEPQEAIVSSIASSSTSSLTSEAEAASAVEVKSTSDSESVLIQSDSSASQNESSRDSLTNIKRLENGCSQQVIKSNKRETSRGGSGRRKAKSANYKQPSINGQQISLIIKEIDLTHTKTIDCDTSGDDEKVVTTSSDEELSCSDDDSEVEKQGKKQEIEAGEDDEQRSIKLLTRLNSTKKDKFRDGNPRQKPEIIPRNIKKETRNELSNNQETFPVTIGAKPEISQNHSANKSHEETAKLSARTSIATLVNSNSRMTTPRSSFAHHASEISLVPAGVIISSSMPRVTSRRSSNASAAAAFAAATAGAAGYALMRREPDCDCPYHQQQVPAHLRRCSTNSSPNGNGPFQRYMSAARGSYQAQMNRPSGINSSQNHLAASASPSNSFPDPQNDNQSPMHSRASSRLSSAAGIEHLYSGSPVQGCTRTPSGRQAAGVNRQRCPSEAKSTPNMCIANNRFAKRNSSQCNGRSVATIRVLSVLRHWVSKHSRDFVGKSKLSFLVLEFLEDVMSDPQLMPAEHKAAYQLQQMIQRATLQPADTVNFNKLLAPSKRPSFDSVETLSALEIAEGLTYLDHKIFKSIRSEEFLDNAWQKKDKAIRAPHILLITKRFNDASRLVSSEILRVKDLTKRSAILEKWINVAHICRVVHNFNGVLQICAAFSHSSVLRLKKTWDKLHKATRHTQDQLQTLVSTGSKFRNMRDAIALCDPPSIPYVGMYLADLNTIEEGTPNYSPDGLLNFSKMRMIAHVIREIQQLQMGSYKIDVNPQVLNYLLDESRLMTEAQMEALSHAAEPRPPPKKKPSITPSITPSTTGNATNSTSAVTAISNTSTANNNAHKTSQDLSQNQSTADTQSIAPPPTPSK